MHRRNRQLLVLLAVVIVLGASAALAKAGGIVVLPEPARKAVTDVTAVVDQVDDGGAPAQDAVANNTPAAPDAGTYREALPDVGAASEIAKIKGDAVWALDRDHEIMRPRDVPANLQSQLADVYAEGVVEHVTAETASAMRHAAADPNYPAYDQYRFTVTQWQGVQITTSVNEIRQLAPAVADAAPRVAVVTVLGYDSWRNGTTWSADKVLQRQLVMALELGRWKIVEQSAFDPDERPARDGDEEFPDGLPRHP